MSLKCFSFRYQYIATLSVLLHLMSIGMHEAWTSAYLPPLENGTSIIQVTSNEGSWVTIFLFFGTLIGCTVAYFITDILGRKMTILLTSVPFFCAGFMLAYAQSVYMFCASRTLAGIATGISITVIPLYVSEIADPQIRGRLGIVVSVFNLAGFFFINAVGSYLSIKTTSFILASLPVLLILTFIWMPESPYFLIMKEKFTEAKSSLSIFMGKDDVELEFKQLKEAILIQNQNKGKFTDLFTKKSNKNALKITFILLTGRQLTSDSVFDVYAQFIFTNFTIAISPVILAVIFYTLKLIVVVVDSAIVDRVGRRPIIFVSFLCISIALLLLAACLCIKLRTSVNMDNLDYISVVPLLIFAVFAALLEPIPMLVLSELFPMDVKLFASYIFQICYFILDMIIIKFFQITTDYIGMDFPFFAFSVSSVIHLILAYKFVMETKGKSLEEIQVALKRC